MLQVLNKSDGDGHVLPYDGHDCELLAHIGKFAATAINNSRLLQQLAAHMGLYTTEGADDLLSALDQPARRENLTLLFADMRGFTQLCSSQADPASTQEIMNDLFTMLADCVLSRGGIVNKFVGDAIFAFFRADHGPKCAVRCAFDMLERFESLRRRWDRVYNEDLEFLDLGIGIATGSVAIGSFGSAAVRDFTAIGTAVNLASAFESCARDGRRVLIDNATFTGVEDILEECDGPLPFELGKPGQAVKVKYRHFHVKRLKPDRPVRVFVSHSHKDREYVERIVTRPLTRMGIETWYSNSDIIPGQKYIEMIEDGLLRCDWVLVVVSDESAESDWVRAEVNTALRDPRFAQRIVPLSTGTAEPAQISHELGQLQVLDLRLDKDPGETLGRWLIGRETELRTHAKSA